MVEKCPNLKTFWVLTKLSTYLVSNKQNDPFSLDSSRKGISDLDTYWSTVDFFISEPFWPSISIFSKKIIIFLFYLSTTNFIWFIVYLALWPSNEINQFLALKIKQFKAWELRMEKISAISGRSIAMIFANLPWVDLLHHLLNHTSSFPTLGYRS